MDKRIRVPDGMLKAGYSVVPDTNDDQCTVQVVLEAALQWLSENPIEPTDEQAEQCTWRTTAGPGAGTINIPLTCAEWQRRMFRVEEPSNVQDLLDRMMGRTFTEEEADAIISRVKTSMMFTKTAAVPASEGGYTFHCPQCKQELKDGATCGTTISVDSDDPIRDLLRDESKVDHCGQLCVDVVKVNDQMRKVFRRGKESR